MSEFGSVSKVVDQSISVISFGDVVDPALEFSVVVPTSVGASTVTIPALVSRTASALATAFDGVITADLVFGDIRVFKGEVIAAPVDSVHQKHLANQVTASVSLSDNKPALAGSVFGFIAGRTSGSR